MKIKYGLLLFTIILLAGCKSKEQKWLDSTVKQWCAVHNKPSLYKNICKWKIGDVESCYMMQSPIAYQVDCALYDALSAKYDEVSGYFNE